MNETILDLAKKYIISGMSVHPLVPFETLPQNQDWQSAPYMTEENIEEVFKHSPDANIGVRLGESTVIASHFLYCLELKINSQNSSDFIDAYKRVEEIYKDYSKLPTSSLGSEIRHFYFLSKILFKSQTLGHSKNQVNFVDIFGEQKVKNAWEVNLLSSGSQVVLPPSRINSKSYNWDKNILDYLNPTQIALMMINDTSLISINTENKKEIQEYPEDSHKYEISEVSRKLDRLPKNFYEIYDDWIKVGMALHNSFDGTEDEQEAINVFDDFFKKSSKYKRGEAYKKWKTFFSEEGGITLGYIFSHIPKETSIDRMGNFSRFLSDEKVNFSSLKDALATCNLKDYELEGFIDLIASALSKNLDKKYSSVSTRKLISALQKEIKDEEDEKMEKMAIGLDDTLATLILKENFNGGKHLLNLNNNIFAYRRGAWVRYEMAVLEQTVLNGIKKIMNSNSLEHVGIKSTIFKKKKADDMDGLTNKIVSLILKMVATPEADDVLNLRNKKEQKFSVVNTLNKEIYIQNGKITVEDHKYDSYLLSQYNVHYSPDDTCPTWLLMLNNVFQRHHDKEDVIRHFCEVLGYILQSKKKEAVFMILLGSGRNGKSFIMSEFSKLMGLDSVVNCDMLKFSQGAHAESALVGKNMLLDDDWKKGQLLPDDYIKKLSESKTLTANPKFKEQFSFVSRCTPVILANSTPKTKDTSYGLERRAHVFNFNYTFQQDEIDHHLDEKLQAERSGFLNLLLKSYIAFEQRGCFRIPASCQKSIQEWLKGSNPLLAFLDEKIIITKDKEDYIQAQDLFNRYKNYIENENFSFQMTRNNFYDDIKNINGLTLQKDSHSKMIYIRGAKLVI